MKYEINERNLKILEGIEIQISIGQYDLADIIYRECYEKSSL